MKAERNDFNVMLGDTIYSDSEVPGPAQPDRAEREAEVGQVQDQPRQPQPPGAAPLGRLLLALGRPRVRQRLLAGRELVRQQRERERAHALQARREGVPRLRAGQLERSETGSTGRSAGAATWSCSSSTSAPSAARTRTPNHVCDNPQTGEPGLRADGPAEHAQCVLGCLAVARTTGVPGLPRRDPQPEPHVPGPAPAHALPA